MPDPENNPSDFIKMAFTGDGELTPEEERYAQDMARAFEGEILDIFWRVKQEEGGSKGVS